jgi:hypothetical protein
VSTLTVKAVFGVARCSSAVDRDRHRESEAVSCIRRDLMTPAQMILVDSNRFFFYFALSNENPHCF